MTSSRPSNTVGPRAYRFRRGLGTTVVSLLMKRIRGKTRCTRPVAHQIPNAAVTTTMGGLRDGVLLDMRTLNSMALDRDAMTVTVGGGVITDDFVRFCQTHGVEVTVGSCPTTGVLGVAFGAGLGRLQGKYGYLHDNMVSARLVMADGSLVTVSKEENPDLFYAVRGAGHNFGIAVEATFRAHKEANNGEHYSWDLEYELTQCEDVFTCLNTIMDDGMPPDLAVFVLWQRESEGGRKVSTGPSIPLQLLGRASTDWISSCRISSSSTLSGLAPWRKPSPGCRGSRRSTRSSTAASRPARGLISPGQHIRAPTAFSASRRCGRARPTR